MRKLVIAFHDTFHGSPDESGSDRVLVGEFPTVILDVDLEKSFSSRRVRTELKDPFNGGTELSGEVFQLCPIHTDVSSSRSRSVRLFNSVGKVLFDTLCEIKRHHLSDQ
jgi:hypothetical protein